MLIWQKVMGIFFGLAVYSMLISVVLFNTLQRDNNDDKNNNGDDNDNNDKKCKFDKNNGSTSLSQNIVGVINAAVSGAIPIMFAVYNAKYSWTEEWMYSLFIASWGSKILFKSMDIVFGSYPKGADQNLKTFAFWYSSWPEPIFKDGKLVPLPNYLRGVFSQIAVWFFVFLQLAFILTLVVNNSDISNISNNETESSSSSISSLYTSMLSMWLIYKFAQSTLEFGALQVMLKGYEAGTTFDHPLTRSASYKETWGTRWNIPIHLALKRCVYIPARRYFKCSPLVSTLIVFVISGLLHEYHFFVHNHAAYTPGHAMLFFLYVGILMKIEETSIWTRYVKRLKKVTPTLVFSILLQIPVLPAFSRFFVYSWFASGMVASIVKMVPHLMCH